MLRRSPTARDWRAYLIAGLCGWELAALLTGKPPTITAVCWRIRSHPVGAAAVMAGLSWLGHHLLVEQESDD